MKISKFIFSLIPPIAITTFITIGFFAWNIDNEILEVDTTKINSDDLGYFSSLDNSYHLILDQSNNSNNGASFIGNMRYGFIFNNDNEELLNKLYFDFTLSITFSNLKLLDYVNFNFNNEIISLSSLSVSSLNNDILDTYEITFNNISYSKYKTYYYLLFYQNGISSPYNKYPVPYYINEPDTYEEYLKMKEDLTSLNLDNNIIDFKGRYIVKTKRKNFKDDRLYPVKNNFSDDL